MRVRKDVLVVGYFWNSHCDDCVRGNHILLVMQGLVVCPGITCAQSIRHPRGFHDAGLEVGHRFEFEEIEVRAVGGKFD